MENHKFGTFDVEVIDLDELKKMDEKSIKSMWNEVAKLEWKQIKGN